MNIKTLKIIFIAFLVAALGFIGYKYLSPTEPAFDAPLVKAQELEPDAGREIIAELNRLNSIKLDGEVFKSKVFMSLHNFALEVTPENQGRNNPFAPFGAKETTASTTKTR